MSRDTLWVGEDEVARLIDLTDAIAALEIGFTAEGRGTAVAMDKTMVGFGGHATLHALGAALEGSGVVGTKTWAHTPGGADPHLLLFSADDGALLAVIDAFVLGQLRTSATAALATDRLARPDAAHLAMIGTGKQALGQVAGVTCVRPIQSVTCFGRDRDKASRFAAQVEAELGVTCGVAGSVDEAVDGADVITLATRATTPILASHDPGPGAHVNAIGAIALDRAEFQPDLLSRCAVVVTDSLPQSRQFSSELHDHYGGPDGDWSQVQTLAELVASGARRPPAADVTLFKGMGSGIEDLALGVTILERARNEGAGSQVHRSSRPRPRLAPNHGASKATSTTNEVIKDGA